jgi:glycosyltransferase involved in cell wall biosynthesis
LLAIQYYFSEDQVVYYEPGDVDGLADCIRRLYANPAERAELACRSAEFAKRFHWDALKLELFKVVDDWPGQERLTVASNVEKAFPQARRS